MKSSENFSSSQTAVEIEEKMTTPESPEDVVTEISGEQLEQYADTTKMHAEQQATEIAQGDEKRDSYQKLPAIFEKAGIESKTLTIENNGEFSEVIILEKKEVTPEKMARLYRGLTDLDASVLEQIPYAMRLENSDGKPLALEQVRQEVDTLAQHPTYEHLLAYADKVRPNLSPEEARRLEDDTTGIEDGILDGYSTRKELVFRQIGHGGGRADSGITPYISSSFDPYEAAQYGNSGLMVIDIPLSQIEDLGGTATEARIKGALDKKYITALLPRKRAGSIEKEEVDQQLYRALQKVYELAPANLYNNEELQTERERKLTEETATDKEQWKKDVEMVKQKRVANLTKQFPEVEFRRQNVGDQDVDSYIETKRNVFDYYKTRLEKIGRGGNNIENYKYQEYEYGDDKKFDRERVDDKMLLKLRTLVQKFEEREEEKKNRR